MDVCVDSNLSELVLELRVVKSSLLHLFVSEQVQDSVASVTLGNHLAIRDVHWVWTNADVSVWQFDAVKWLQEVAIASLSRSVNDEHLLGVPLLVVVRILSTVV